MRIKFHTLFCVEIITSNVQQDWKNLHGSAYEQGQVYPTPLVAVSYAGYTASSTTLTIQFNLLVGVVLFFSDSETNQTLPSCVLCMYCTKYVSDGAIPADSA